MSGYRIVVKVPNKIAHVENIDGLHFEKDDTHRPVRGYSFFSATTLDPDFNTVRFTRTIQGLYDKATLEYEPIKIVNAGMNELAERFRVVNSLGNVDHEPAGGAGAPGKVTRIIQALEQGAPGVKPVKGGPVIKPATFNQGSSANTRKHRRKGRSKTRSTTVVNRGHNGSVNSGHNGSVNRGRSGSRTSSGTRRHHRRSRSRSRNIRALNVAEHNLAPTGNRR